MTKDSRGRVRFGHHGRRYEISKTGKFNFFVRAGRNDEWAPQYRRPDNLIMDPSFMRKLTVAYITHIAS